MRGTVLQIWRSLYLSTLSYTADLDRTRMTDIYRLLPSR